MSSTISITKGFGIPFVLFHSSPQFDQSVLRSSGIEKFLAGKTRVLFFNPPICQKMRVGAEKINLSAEVFATHARCYFTAKSFRVLRKGKGGATKSFSIQKIILQILDLFEGPFLDVFRKKRNIIFQK